MTKAQVVKHNNLIDAKANLSPLATKLMMVFISYIKHNFKDPDSEIIEDRYQILTKNLYAFLGLENSKNARQKIVQAARELNKPVRLQSLDKKEVTYAFWLQDMTFTTEGYIYFTFGQKLHRYLIKMRKEYTQYQLQYSLALKKAHSLKLYEFFKRWAFSKTKVQSIEEVRNLLHLNEKQYTDYYDFKLNCLITPIKEIEKNTPLRIVMQEIKVPNSKKVDKIRFIISEEKEASALQKQIDLLESLPVVNNEIAAISIEELRERFYDAKNSPEYNHWYCLFMKHKHKYPDTWTFKQFIETETGAQIIQHKNGKGWDLLFLQYTNQIKAEL